MRIGVTGASGKLGTATLNELKARGQGVELVGISRSPDKVRALGVEARFGDFDQPDSLTDAFAGLDRLLIIPTDAMQPGVRGRQNQAAVQRAVEAGVEHILFTSILGSKWAEPTDLRESYFVTEQALTRSAKKWTVLRMSLYAESFVDEVRMSLAHGALAATSRTPVNCVSREDVAAAAAGILLTDGHHGATYYATGPEALDGPTRAALVARITGKPFSFAQVTPEAYREGLLAAGLPAFVAEVLVSIQDMCATGAFHLTTGDVERLAGRPPRSLEEVIQRAF